MSKKYLTIAETSQAIGLSETSVRRRLARREIEHLKLGKAIRIPATAVDRFLAEATVPAEHKANRGDHE